jgi:hypothetical protein
MKCPHCLEGFHQEWEQIDIQDNPSESWIARDCSCPLCGKLIIELGHRRRVTTAAGIPGSQWEYRLIEPKGIARSPLPAEVPSEFAEDYKEACLVIFDSPKASAALSRRCLQNIIQKKLGIVKKNLDQEIQEVLNQRLLPGYLAESLHAVRVVGNLSAHPTKSTSTGEIVNVEPGEADWNLDVVEGLFDFCFVQPARMQQKKDQLNQKLSDAGKPTLQ